MSHSVYFYLRDKKGNRTPFAHWGGSTAVYELCKGDGGYLNIPYCGGEVESFGVVTAEALGNVIGELEKKIAYVKAWTEKRKAITSDVVKKLGASCAMAMAESRKEEDRLKMLEMYTSRIREELEEDWAEEEGDAGEMEDMNLALRTLLGYRDIVEEMKDWEDDDGFAAMEANYD